MTRDRASYIGAPQIFNLNNACRLIGEAFGHGHTYLVGSSLETRDYRDVDVRFIMDDDEFDAMFPDMASAVSNRYSARWTLICTSISECLNRVTGLPVDFQIQRRSDANAEHKGRRIPLGLHMETRRL